MTGLGWCIGRCLRASLDAFQVTVDGAPERPETRPLTRSFARWFCGSPNHRLGSHGGLAQSAPMDQFAPRLCPLRLVPNASPGIAEKADRFMPSPRMGEPL